LKQRSWWSSGLSLFASRLAGLHFSWGHKGCPRRDASWICDPSYTRCLAE